MDTRWMALTRGSAAVSASWKGCFSMSSVGIPSSAGLLISACPPHTPGGGLGMQCHRYSIDDFDGPEDKLQQRVKHFGELVPQATTDFCIDVAQMGVGGIDSWGSRPLAQHMIPADRGYEWSFWLRPFSNEETSSKNRALALSSLARSQ